MESIPFKHFFQFNFECIVYVEIELSLDFYLQIAIFDKGFRKQNYNKLKIFSFTC